MAEEINELLVKLRPDGMDETTDGLDDVQETFTETADTAGDASETLSNFSERMKGAMAVVVTALATAAAGLLTQVPVIGEAASGLMAIVDAIALKMDEVLRPVLGPIARGLFQIADAIAQAEGPFGTFVGVLGSVTALVLLAEGAVLALNAALGWGLASVLGTIVGILGGPLTVAILAIIALVAGLLYAWENNLFGIRDVTMDAFNTIKQAVMDFIEFARPYFEKFLKQVFEGDWIGALNTLSQYHSAIFDFIVGLVVDFAKRFVMVVAGLVATAGGMVQKLRARFRTGFETMFALVINAAKSWANSFVGIIETAVNKAIRAIPSSVRSKLGLETVSLGDPFETQSTSEIVAAGGRRFGRRERRIESQTQQGESAMKSQFDRLITEMQNTDLQTTLNLDGRQVAQAVEPMLGSGAAGTGRTGSR